VALLPQTETFDHEGLQTNPCGFHLIHLPYADDIRHIDVPPSPTTDNEQILKAKKIVKTLRIKFDSLNFENPALQKHYANLQALALDRDVVEETPDYVVPDEEGIEKHAELIDDFKKSVFPDGYCEQFESQSKSKSKKRSNNESDNDGQNSPSSIKRGKQELNLEDLHDLTDQQLSKLTIPQLKAYLTSHQVPFSSKLKKQQLLDLVQSHL